MGKAKKAPGENVRITTEAWYQEVVGDPALPTPDRLEGRQLELLKAMEDGGPAVVRPLIESWGLVWVVGPRGAISVDVPPAEGAQAPA